MRSTGTRGLSSRAVLLALAIVAIAGVAALFGLAGSGSKSERSVPTKSTSGPKDDPRASLEQPAESGSARAEAPDEESRKTTAPAGTRTLLVSGTVIDAGSRNVVPGVDVEAKAGPLPGGTEARTKARADAEGRYSLALVIPADLAWDPKVWSVRVFADGDRFASVNHRLQEADFRPDATDPSTSIAIHDLEIQLQLAWSGRLVRESDGTPIAGGAATLLAVAKAPVLPRSIGETQTDETGRFLLRMESVEPGDLAMLVSAGGFLARMIPTSYDSGQAVDLGTISLAEGQCIEGHVTTSNGSKPAATEIHAFMRASDDAWMFMSAGTWAVRAGGLVPRGAQATIGTDGSFRLCGLAPDEYSLSASYPGCVTGSRLESSLDVRAPASGIRIQLSRAVYRLRVLDAQSGNALERSRFLFDGPQEMACYIEGDYVIATDPGIESPGRIVAEGYRALNCTLPALGASEVRDLEFRLEPLALQVSATIVVLSPAGTPVEDIQVQIRGEAGEAEGQGSIPNLSHTAPDGRHELPKLVPGTYHLTVDPSRQGVPSADTWLETWLGAEIEIEVREGMEPIEVRLGEGGLVQATVTKKDGTPVDARTSLVRSLAAEPEILVWRNDTGTFWGWIPKQTVLRLATPLPAGPWTLRFEADGCVSQDVLVNVIAGATTAIEIALEPKPPR